MRMAFKATLFSVGVAAAAMAGVSSAHAGPVTPDFGPASAGFAAGEAASNVGASQITLGGSMFILSSDGSLAGASTGTQNATLNYSTSIGATVNAGNNQLAAFTFSDGSGDTFKFDLTSVETTAFNSSPGSSVSLTLFLLGDMGEYNSDGVLIEDLTATSITLSFNQTGNATNPFAEAGTLANPPAPPPAVPEPASMALLGVGMTAVGVIRRRKNKKQ
jgi:PEP-CTERM motif